MYCTVQIVAGSYNPPFLCLPLPLPFLFYHSFPSPLLSLSPLHTPVPFPFSYRSPFIPPTSSPSLRPPSSPSHLPLPFQLTCWHFPELSHRRFGIRNSWKVGQFQSCQLKNKLKWSLPKKLANIRLPLLLYPHSPNTCTLKYINSTLKFKSQAGKKQIGIDSVRNWVWGIDSSADWLVLATVGNSVNDQSP